MLHLLRRHPFAITANLKHSFVLTYAYPEAQLQPLLPPGLKIDRRNGCGFLAVAFVEAHHLRPAGTPEWLGRDFKFIGYRLFTRYQTREGRRLRGLYILRSEVDRRSMTWTGNLLTHYHWRHARFSTNRSLDQYHLNVTTPGGETDVEVEFDLTDAAPPLPEDSCFDSWQEARLFAGPMPFTFNYEPQTHSIIRVEGVREDWHPHPVEARVKKIRLLTQDPLARLGPPRLVSAFAIHEIPYLWKAGIVEKLQ